MAIEEPTVDEIVAKATKDTPEQILGTRTFHHGNLVLSMIFNPYMDIYRIEVERLNTGEKFDMWGIWDREWFRMALTKFESISL